MTAVLLIGGGTACGQGAVPAMQVIALDGHSVTLPKDASGPTIFIVGFSRNSADATTAWEVPIRRTLASDRVGFYDLAILESVPGFLHGWVVRSLKGKVPPVLHSRFLPVFSHEKEWKQVCGYDSHWADAAYIVLADKDGRVLWKTHDPYSPVGFTQLKAQLHP